MNEAERIEAIKKQPALFGAVYNEEYSTIFNYCFKRTGDFYSAKDICSETFLKAFLGIQNFKWRGIPLRSWLYRIASNEIQLYYRSKKYRPKVLRELDLGDSLLNSSLKTNLEEEQALAEMEMIKHAQFLAIREQILKLPLKYQEVISLKYFEKLKIREIATVLNKPEGTVKSLLSRGIKILKHQM